MTEKEKLTRKRKKLKDLIFPLLKCVHCHSGDLKLLKREITCLTCKEVYPLFRETPIMLLEPGQAFDYIPGEVVTRPYNKHWYKIMGRAKGGAIMDLGCGNTPQIIENLIKFDMFAMPNVEVVGDAEKMPFKKQSFSLIFSSSAFDHFRNPFLVADNAHEALIDNGILYVESGFMQPWHTNQNHFFNMTKPGIEEMFYKFEKVESGTLPHMYSSFTLMGILNGWLQKQTPAQRQEFCNATIGEIQAEYTKNPLSLRWMENFTKKDQEELAAGVFFFGRKYLSDPTSLSVPFVKKPNRGKMVSSSSLSEKTISSSDLTRIDKVMSMIDKKGLGLEIGPSINPIAPKKLGFNVHILDIGVAEDLREKYKEHEVDLKNIEEVDFVWHGQSFPELIGQTECYDWIIASHVLEHMPDMISFLTDCEKLLKPNGVLSLVIPDKRYCFDYFHGTTTTGDILDAFEQKRKRPSPGKVFDFCARSVKSDGRTTWSSDTDFNVDLELFDDIFFAKNNWESARTTDIYIDVHSWRFTPASFRLLLSDLQALGLTGFEIKKEFDTTGCEFYVTLGKNLNGVPLENSKRMDLLKRIREDDELNS